MFKKKDKSTSEITDTDLALGHRKTTRASKCSPLRYTYGV